MQNSKCSTRLEMLAQRARMRVALVAAAHLAQVRLVARVHMRVLLAIARVGEATIATGMLAWKRLFPCTQSVEISAIAVIADNHFFLPVERRTIFYCPEHNFATHSLSYQRCRRTARQSQ